MKHNREIEEHRDGFRRGWSYGHHYGMCAAIVERVVPAPSTARDVHVLYVQEGSPGFVPIDAGIIEALQGTVSRLTVIRHTDPVVDLAVAHAVDLVLVLNAIHSVKPEVPRRLRELGVHTAVWFADDPYFSDKTAEYVKDYEFVFTNEGSCLDFYRSLGCVNVHYLPFAGATGMFRPLPVPPEYQSDVCFIGSPFWSRVAVFNQIAERLEKRKVVIGGNTWLERVKNPALFRRFTRGPIMPPEAVHYYNGAKIVINIHRSATGEENCNSRGLPAYGLNPRTFDMAAAGAFQLSDEREDLPSLYVPGQEIVTYRTPKELADLIDHYLLHEEERHRIAAGGLARTRREHHYFNRLERMLQTVFN